MNGGAVLKEGAVVRERLRAVAGFVFDQAEIVVGLGIARI